MASTENRCEEASVARAPCTSHSHAILRGGKNDKGLEDWCRDIAYSATRSQSQHPDKSPYQSNGLAHLWGAPLPDVRRAIPSHVSRDHRLPALRYLNVLNNYRLLPAGSHLLQGQKGLLIYLHHACGSI